MLHAASTRLRAVFLHEIVSALQDVFHHDLSPVAAEAAVAALPRGFKPSSLQERAAIIIAIIPAALASILASTSRTLPLFSHPPPLPRARFMMNFKQLDHHLSGLILMMHTCLF